MNVHYAKFKKSLIVEQFSRNYLKELAHAEILENDRLPNSEEIMLLKLSFNHL